jgi:hypothetical protein
LGLLSQQILTNVTKGITFILEILVVLSDQAVDLLLKDAFCPAGIEGIRA